MDALIRLERWYESQCFDEFERPSGISITTITNPGWAVDIPLDNTVLNQMDMDDHTVNTSEHDWMFCSVRDNTFVGRGGPLNLHGILAFFCDWSDRVAAG